LSIGSGVGGRGVPNVTLSARASTLEHVIAITRASSAHRISNLRGLALGQRGASEPSEDPRNTASAHTRLSLTFEVDWKTAR
jgi:hypothetical protein